MKLKSIIAIVFLLLTSANLSAQTQIIELQKESKVKIIPHFGITLLRSDYMDYNSTINTGVALDFMLGSRFSLGATFNYSLFELNDDQYAYSSRELDLRQFNIGAQAKFFIIPHGLIRPFIGGGINYSHNKLDHADDNQNYYNSVRRLYNQEYTFGSVAGTLVAGSEIKFSRNVGLVLDYRYSRNLTTGLNRRVGGEAVYNGLVPYEMEEIEYDLEDAHSSSLNLGFVLSF